MEYVKEIRKECPQCKRLRTIDLFPLDSDNCFNCDDYLTSLKDDAEQDERKLK